MPLKLSKLFRRMDAEKLWSKITTALASGTPPRKVSDLISKVTGIAQTLVWGPKDEPPKDHELIAMIYHPENQGPKKNGWADFTPLVIKLGELPDGSGFIGCNVHYLTPGTRETFIDRIKEVGRLSDSERYDVGTIALSQQAMATYLYSRIRAQMPLDAAYWPALENLPSLAAFNWGQARMVYMRRNLRKKIAQDATDDPVVKRRVSTAQRRRAEIRRTKYSNDYGD